MTSDDPKHKKKNHGHSHNKHHHTKHKEGGPHQDIESQSHQSGMSANNNSKSNNEEGVMVVTTIGGNRPRLNTDKSETGFEMYAEFIEGQQEEEEVKEGERIVG